MNTRHNVGFKLVDDFILRMKLEFKPSKYDYYFAQGEIEENPFIIIKPSSYVNNSGLAALQCVNKYNLLPQNLLVVVDDVNLAFGEIRIRKSGGDGGHNGLNSIIYHLNTNDFPRIRFGIGEEFEKGYLSDYVLSKFSENEIRVLTGLMDLTAHFIKAFIIGGPDFLLSEYSRLKNIKTKENKASKTNESME
jgi:peptidyl-tRNA hydrolase, PTH1 family